MFALGIIDKVGSVDLTKGNKIAGTGTIDPTGKVGAIGGIQLKMIAARRDGATIFLAPDSQLLRRPRQHPERAQRRQGRHPAQRAAGPARPAGRQGRAALLSRALCRADQGPARGTSIGGGTFAECGPCLRRVKLQLS